jgi:hypothetical protein
MLKQEEALAELDTSIDDWVAKLEKAENRRTRVRQKLLEHVAAAATLPSGAAAASESLQLAMGIRSPPPMGVGNISTPPRSPTKPGFSSHSASNSPSPQRVVAQVPSTILEQPLVEEAAALDEEKGALAAAFSRADVQSIRIYADSDVYALLADVENEITKMGVGIPEPVSLSDVERRKLNRARSHELLSGFGMGIEIATPPSPPAPSPPMKDIPVVEGDGFLLTNAVFRPGAPERAYTTT